MRNSERVNEIIIAADAAWHRLPLHYQEAGAAWTRADPHVVAHELRRMSGRRCRFLEWGSGIGTHCLIADALGMQAHGIEIDGRLVRSATELAGRLDAGSVFGDGTFIPRGRECPPADEDVSELLLSGGADGYAALAGQLGVPPDSASIAATYDVIYAYPAPQHIDWFADLFRDLARVGAVLWCYTETAGILTSTKTGSHTITPLRPA